MFDFFKSVVIPVALIFIVMLVAIGLYAAFIGIPMDKYMCKQRGLALGVESKYSDACTCVVKIDNGKWVEINSYVGVAK